MYLKDRSGFCRENGDGARDGEVTTDGHRGGDDGPMGNGSDHGYRIGWFRFI